MRTALTRQLMLAGHLAVSCPLASFPGRDAEPEVEPETPWTRRHISWIMDFPIKKGEMMLRVKLVCTTHLNVR